MIGMATLLPDVHRELYRVTVLGDMVAVELSIQGTFLGPLETPAGTVKPTGAKIDIPCGDFWYLRNGRIEVFNCYALFGVMYEQMGASRLRVRGCRAHRRVLSCSGRGGGPDQFLTTPS